MDYLVNLFEETTSFYIAFESIWNDMLNGSMPELKAIEMANSLIQKIPKENMLNKLRVSLGNKAQHLLNLRTQATEDHAIFRRFIKFLISLNNPDVINAMESHYVSDSDPTGIIILIEELQKADKDISSFINTFFSLLEINGIKYESVDKLLIILKKERSFVIESLIAAKKFSIIRYYIYDLFKDSDNDIQLCIVFSKIIYQHREIFESKEYSAASSLLVSFNKNVLPVIINNYLERANMETYIIYNGNHFTRGLELLKNYCDFLDDKYLDSFESKFLPNVGSAGFILSYAKSVPRSNKREVLKALFVLKSKNNYDGYVVQFLKYFPQYKHLLMML